MTVASQGLLNASFQVINIFGKVVGQVGIFGSRPDLLNWIEVRGIRRQPLNVKTSGKAFAAPSRRRGSLKMFMAGRGRLTGAKHCLDGAWEAGYNDRREPDSRGLTVKWEIPVNGSI